MINCGLGHPNLAKLRIIVPTMPEIATNNPQIPKVNISDDFQIGAFTVQDLYKIVLNEILESSIGKSLNLEKFLFELRRGDDHAVITTLIIAFIFTLLSIQIASYLFQSEVKSEQPSNPQQENEDDKEPPRDFTVEQLREFDGTNDKAIYIGLKGEVFDVSAAANFYGVGQSYSCFAGREASRAMARLSFEEEDLGSLKIDDLGPFEKSSLDDWYQKFKYFKCYPVVGRVSQPPEPKAFTLSELSEFTGKGAIPTNRIDAPIYIAINGKVLDVSYGGIEP